MTKVMLTSWLLGTLCLATASQSFAAPSTDPIDAAHQACVDANTETGTTLGCLTDVEAKWDAELNKVYQELLATMPKPRQNKLRKAQRVWLKQRDRKFAKLQQENQDQGSMGQIESSEGQIDVVKKRVLELRKQQAAATKADMTK
jgi:uncharacterized protein YecT (DUF1311 family)